MLKHGKHSGAPYQQVAAEDRKYCAWVLREERDSNQLSHNMKAFATYLKQQHGGLMTVGKHAGKFFNELMKEDPEYAIWVQSLAQPSAAMKEFAEYIAEQQQIREDDQNRKRPRDEASEGKCIVCLDRALTAAFIPCGHCVSADGKRATLASWGACILSVQNNLPPNSSHHQVLLRMRLYDGEEPLPNLSQSCDSAALVRGIGGMLISR